MAHGYWAIEEDIYLTIDDDIFLIEIFDSYEREQEWLEEAGEEGHDEGEEMPWGDEFDPEAW